MSNSVSSRLRPMSDGDLDMVREWRNAPAIRENMYTSHEITRQEHMAWWETTKAASDSRYLVYETNSVPIGVVSFNKIDKINNNAFWAFYAAPDAIRGTGSQMELLALDFAFTELNLHKLSCEVLGFNSRVVKLHQKFGFLIEGTFRQQFVKNGQWHDVYRLGILASEWRKIRDEIQSRMMRAEVGDQ